MNLIILLTGLLWTNNICNDSLLCNAFLLLSDLRCPHPVFVRFSVQRNLHVSTASFHRCREKILGWFLLAGTPSESFLIAHDSSDSSICIAHDTLCSCSLSLSILLWYWAAWGLIVRLRSQFRFSLSGISSLPTYSPDLIIFVDVLSRPQIRMLLLDVFVVTYITSFSLIERAFFPK